MAYLDHAASSPLRPAARDAWLAAAAHPGNPSATHWAGRQSRRLLEEARESVAELLGAHPTEVVFTSGGTEAAALAVLGSARARANAPRGDGGRGLGVVVGSMEHPAVLGAAAMLAQEGYGVSFFPTTSAGRHDPAALPEFVGPGTALVSLMWVNNETGIVQPVMEAVARAREVGALVHSDAVAAVGHLEVNFQASGLDMLSISGHKFGGPVGTGALLARRGLALAPLTGGGGQERGVRSGTVDVAGAAGLAAALRLAVAERTAEAVRLAALRDEIGAALVLLGGVRVTGAELAGELRAPGTVHVVLEGLRSEDLLFALDREGVAASAGSACRAGVQQPSHVVLAMGGTAEEAAGTLRCSLGWSTTASEVAALIGALPGAVAAARRAHASRS